MSEPLVDALVDAATARQAVRAGRAAFRKSPASAFVRSMQGAMREYSRMVSEGVSPDDAARGIEAILRDTWPHTPRRSDGCSDCDGTGWRERTCQHILRCGRRRCGFAEPQWEHPYVVPCDCVDGDRHRAKAQTAEDSLVSVGRARRKASKGWRRMGET